MKKISKSFLLIMCCTFLLSITAQAKSHNGTYDMTGGIFYKKSFEKGTNLSISVSPTLGTPDCTMGIYTADKNIIGWTGMDFITDVSSISQSSTKYTTKSKIDGIYFRDWAGQRWTGSFMVSW